VLRTAGLVGLSAATQLIACSRLMAIAGAKLAWHQGSSRVLVKAFLLKPGIAKLITNVSSFTEIAFVVFVIMYPNSRLLLPIVLGGGSLLTILGVIMVRRTGQCACEAAIEISGSIDWKSRQVAMLLARNSIIFGSIAIGAITRTVPSSLTSVGDNRPWGIAIILCMCFGVGALILDKYRTVSAG
jgi:hypothetical protein